MKPRLLAVRSIGAEFANRIYFIVALITSIIAVGLLILTYWLTTLSSWWWVCMALLIILLSIIIGVLFVIKLVIRSVTPPQSPTQRKQIKAFVDKLERLSETAQTPKLILLFRIVRDIAAPRENGLIATISSDTNSLKRDFSALSESFRQ